MTVTFVTESMAAANAIVHIRTVRHLKKVMKTEDAGSEDNSQLLVVRFLLFLLSVFAMIPLKYLPNLLLIL